MHQDRPHHGLDLSMYTTKNALSRDSASMRHATIDGVFSFLIEKRANRFRHGGWGAGQLQLDRCKPMLLEESTSVRSEQKHNETIGACRIMGVRQNSHCINGLCRQVGRPREA